MLRFIYLYKLPQTGDQVHLQEVFAVNKEAANMKWGEMKKLTPEMEDVTEKHIKKEAELA